MLLALALIFLPIVFDGEGSYQPEVRSRIPEAPEISILPEPEPVRPVILSDNPELLAEREPDNAEAEPVEPSSPTNVPDEESIPVTESQPVFTATVPELDESGLPQGWSVRLGAFSDFANASSLLERLQAAGYRAYARQVVRDDSELTAIFVGPWLDRGQSEEYLDRLRDEFLLSGMVVRYEPESL